MFNTRELLLRRKSSELGYISHSVFAIYLCFCSFNAFKNIMIQAQGTEELFAALIVDCS